MKVRVIVVGLRAARRIGHHASRPSMTNATLLGSAREVGERLTALFRRGGAKRAIVAGEARRGVPLVSELVVLACGIAPRKAAEALRVACAELRRVRTCGSDVTARLEGAGAVRVRIVREPDWVKA